MLYKMKMVLPLIYILFHFSLHSQIPNNTTLRVGNLDFDLGGDVRVQVFKRSQPFDFVGDLKPVEKLQVTLEQAQRVKLPELEPGEYMIAVFHDSNQNGKMDYNFFGSPQEGYGFSGEFLCNTKYPGPELHYIRLSGGDQEITINICY